MLENEGGADPLISHFQNLDPNQVDEQYGYNNILENSRNFAQRLANIPESREINSSLKKSATERNMSSDLDAREKAMQELQYQNGELAKMID
jgi:hypothetical protein